MRVADAVVDILKTEGVKFVATLPGDDILPIFDALHENGQVRLILTRHEQATVYIADGYARSTGEVGVAMVTKGPGRCNAFTAIVNAFTDCVPLVVIFGHSSRKQLAKGMLQEVPYLDTFQTVAKWTFSVPSAERIPEVFRRAFTLARSGRPGPVIIEIPQDISMAQAELPPYYQTRRVRFGPDPDDVDKLIELLQSAKRPLIYVGRGALWSARRTILSKSPRPTRCPSWPRFPAKGAMPEDHPLCLGLGGYPRAVYSTGQSRKFAEEADLVIALGCSLSPACDVELVAQAGARQARPGRYRSRRAAQELSGGSGDSFRHSTFLAGAAPAGKGKTWRLAEGHGRGCRRRRSKS